jgi:hypothetical protein
MRFFILIAVLTLPLAAHAACTCTCMNGRNQAICTIPGELQPICGPAICPIQPTSITPIQPLRIPPLGTKSCKPEQVYDYGQRRYVWRTICR